MNIKCSCGNSFSLPHHPVCPYCKNQIPYDLFLMLLDLNARIAEIDYYINKRSSEGLIGPFTFDIN